MTEGPNPMEKVPGADLGQVLRNVNARQDLPQFPGLAELWWGVYVSIFDQDSQVIQMMFQTLNDTERAIQKEVEKDGQRGQVGGKFKLAGKM